jgi:stalled ribosome alternative rescue factor ArfA
MTREVVKNEYARALQSPLFRNRVIANSKARTYCFPTNEIGP